MQEKCASIASINQASVQVQEKIPLHRHSTKYVCKCKRKSHSVASSMCARAKEDLIAKHQVCVQVQEDFSLHGTKYARKCKRKSQCLSMSVVLSPHLTPTLPRRTLAKPCKSTCKGHITPPCLYAKLRTNCACLPCRCQTRNSQRHPWEQTFGVVCQTGNTL